MKALKEFSLPISGLKNGVHTYGFTVANDFFKSFEESPIAGGSLEADVEVDIKPSMMVLDMKIDGTVNAVCDRCLADIDLPISGEYRLIVKVGESEGEVGEIVYISPDATTFNMAKYIHELVCLSVPISKTYDCEDEKDLPCDLDTLKRLNVRVEEEKEEEKDDPWNVLKDIDLN